MLDIAFSFLRSNTAFKEEKSSFVQVLCKGIAEIFTRAEALKSEIDERPFELFHWVETCECGSTLDARFVYHPRGGSHARIFLLAFLVCCTWRAMACLRQVCLWRDAQLGRNVIDTRGRRPTLLASQLHSVPLVWCN